jgi:unsaturated rhamnogalacturonyl hydrolase
VKVIGEWVKAGGSLLLMGNDSANCELKNFNKLAAVFGVAFTDKSVNMVKNDIYEQGVVYPGIGNQIFKTPAKMFLKELSVLNFWSPPANVNATKDGDVIIATTQYGKGKVLIVGDPWLYNEYVDGRKLPAEYENYAAAADLVKWLLSGKNKNEPANKIALQ